MASSGGRSFAVAALVGLAPTVLLIAYCLRSGTAAVRELTKDRTEDIAVLTRALVERQFQSYTSALRGLAESPAFLSAVRARQEDVVRDQLGPFVEAQPTIVRAFVTTPDGFLWSDYPAAPESLGKCFAARDWFRGVSRTWEPYVSRVYRRHASPSKLILAVAVPIRARGGATPAGIVVCQVELEALTRTLKEFSFGRRGHAFLLDHEGIVAAHPHLDLQEREHALYATAAPVLAARSGGAHGVEYLDPVAKEPMFASSVPCEVGTTSWTVVVQCPVSEANEPLVALAAQTGVAGVLALAMVAGVFWVQTRAQRRIADLNARLSVENGQREAAEAALRVANEQLEARVEQRTKELQQTQAQLLHAQKMEAVGLLAGGIAHDFNNLLTVILGFSEMALAKLRRDDPATESIQLILQAGQQAGALTKQLLAFSRKQVMRPEPLDLGAVVQGAKAILARVLGEDIELVVKTSPSLDPVLADASQAEQVVMNLAVNARDAMPRGGKLTIETRNVTLDAEHVREHPESGTGPHVLLAVSDTGHGMDAATRERIFEPFFTTKGLGRGTGLGLSTVYGIVKQSGGNIWVRSEPGQGTTFEIYIPVSRADQPRSAPGGQPVAAAARSRATILVVEDEPAVRGLVQSVLQTAGYTVLCAANAEEARRIHERHGHAVDLLLTDVVMPGVGGRELAQALTARQPRLGVLYMSGYTDDAIVQHGVLDPGTAFLEKPVTPSKLLDKVRTVLSGAAW